MTIVRTAVWGMLSAVVLLSVIAAAAAAQTNEDAIQMSWDGRTYVAETFESFVGTPVVVPGDHASRTLLVRNEGPSEGVLRAAITNVELLGGASAAGDDDFYDDLTVHWSNGKASMNELGANEATEVIERPLEEGETTELTIGYKFPLQSTSGNRAEVGARSASFDVVLTLGGERPSDPENSSSAAPPSSGVVDESSSEGGQSVLTPQRPGPDFLAETGWSALWLAVLGALAIAVGGWLRRTAAKRNNARTRTAAAESQPPDSRLK